MDEVALLCAEFERLTGVPSRTMVGAPVRAMQLIVEHLRRRAAQDDVKRISVPDDALVNVLLRAVTDGEVEALFVGSLGSVPAPLDTCSECRRARRPREHWPRCFTCQPDKVLHICPACVPVHQAEHAAQGDTLPPEPDFACETSEPVTAAAEQELDTAIATFDAQVDAAMGQQCASCGEVVRVHIGRLCYLCWNEAGKPRGPVEIVAVAGKADPMPPAGGR